MSSRNFVASAVRCNISSFSTSSTANGSTFGRLWGRGYEQLRDRRIVRILGPGAEKYLQNLITSNIFEIPLTPRAEIAHNGDKNMPKVRFNPQLCKR